MCILDILLLYRLRSNCPARGGNERPPRRLISFRSRWSVVVAISLDTMEPPPPLLHFVALFKSRKIARLPRLQLDHIRSTGRLESLAPPRLPPQIVLASLDFDRTAHGRLDDWNVFSLSLIGDSFWPILSCSKIGVSFGILNGRLSNSILHRKPGALKHCLFEKEGPSFLPAAQEESEEARESISIYI